MTALLYAPRRWAAIATPRAGRYGRLGIARAQSGLELFPEGIEQRFHRDEVGVEVAVPLPGGDRRANPFVKALERRRGSERAPELESLSRTDRFDGEDSRRIRNDRL